VVVEAEQAAATGAAGDRAPGDRVLTWLGFEVPEVMEPSTMRVVAEAAERLGVGVHTHFAEYEPGDVARLADAGLLRGGTSLAHCVWLSDDDVAAFAASGTSVSHNPKSNSRCGNGVAPLRKLLEAGVVSGSAPTGRTRPSPATSSRRRGWRRSWRGRSAGTRSPSAPRRPWGWRPPGERPHSAFTTTSAGSGGGCART